MPVAVGAESSRMDFALSQGFAVKLSREVGECTVRGRPLVLLQQQLNVNELSLNDKQRRKAKRRSDCCTQYNLGNSAMKIPKGTFCVFVNSVWTPLKDAVGFNDVFKNTNFRKLIPAMKKGETQTFSGHSYKVQM